MNQIFEETSETSLIGLIDYLKRENDKYKNGITGQNAIALNTLLFINNPTKFVAIVSLVHRRQVMHAFALGNPGDFKTYGQEVILSNRAIINGFREKYGLDASPRDLTQFLYAPYRDHTITTGAKAYWLGDDKQKAQLSKSSAGTLLDQPHEPITHLDSSPAPVEPVVVDTEPTDPVPRIGMLRAANREPITVTRDTEVVRATTIMVQRNFSQLPVMQNTRDVDGLISWRSIGEAAIHNRECKFVRECMEDYVEIRDDRPLLDAVRTIADKEVVLIRNRMSKQIIGLVTTSDLADEYHSLAEPFLLIKEIENHLRQLITSQANGYFFWLVACPDEEP